MKELGLMANTKMSTHDQRMMKSCVIDGREVSPLGQAKPLLFYPFFSSKESYLSRSRLIASCSICILEFFAS